MMGRMCSAEDVKSGKIRISDTLTGLVLLPERKGVLKK